MPTRLFMNCLVVWNILIMFHNIYGMSSFSLTFIFFKMVIAPPTSEKYRALQLQDIPRIRNDHSERTASWFLLCRNCFPVVWVGSQRHQTLEVKIKIRLVWWEPFGTGDVAASCESQLWGVSLLIWLWGTQICFFGFFFPFKMDIQGYTDIQHDFSESQLPGWHHLVVDC